MEVQYQEVGIAVCTLSDGDEGMFHSLLIHCPVRIKILKVLPLCYKFGYYVTSTKKAPGIPLLYICNFKMSRVAISSSLP